MVTIEEKIGNLSKLTFDIKRELTDLIKPLIKNKSVDIENISIIVDEAIIDNVVISNGSVMFEVVNKVRYSFLHLSVMQLYDVYKYLSV